jgi:glycosyltransferase involved in cell wall biosynthesis
LNYPWSDGVRLTVILPAYNEESTIAAVLDRIIAVDLVDVGEPVEKEIIVVDDASADRTVEVIRETIKGVSGTALLCHEQNAGKGAAIMTGLKQASGDVILIQDADLEYEIGDYPALLCPFLNDEVMVVYGSRFLRRKRPTGMRFANYMANRILTLTANLLFGMRITDEATCFKVFRGDVIHALPLKARGFDFCPEVTALVRLAGHRIYEVPIDYTARTHAEGKKVRWTDGFQAIKTLLAYRLRGKKALRASVR